MYNHTPEPDTRATAIFVRHDSFGIDAQPELDIIVPGGVQEDLVDAVEHFKPISAA